MQDEIQITFGGNLTPLASSLRSMKSMVKEAGQEAMRSLGGIATGFIGIEGVNKIADWTKRSVEWAKSIRNVAEETGTSTEFVQGLQHVVDKLGLDSSRATDALGFLSRKIGEARDGSKEAQAVFSKFGVNINGKTTEEVFFEIADALSHTSDASQRAEMRFQLLGRAGKEMAEAMDHGSGKIKETMAEAAKLTDAQIQQLSNLGRAWKDFFEMEATGWKKIFAAMGSKDAPQLGITKEDVQKRAEQMFPAHKYSRWQLGGIIADKHTRTPAELSAALESLIEEKNKETNAPGATKASEHHRQGASRIKSGEEVLKLVKQAEEIRHQNSLKAMTDEERLKALTLDKLALQRKILDTHTSIKDKAEAQVQLEKKNTEIAETQEKIKQKTLEKQQKEADLSKQIREKYTELDRLGREASADQRSGLMPTLEQLANTGQAYLSGSMWRWRQGPFAAQARELLNLQSDAPMALAWGNKDRFNADVSRIEELKKGLRDAGVMSGDDRLANIQESNEKIQQDIASLVRQAQEQGLKVQLPEG